MGSYTERVSNQPRRFQFCFCWNNYLAVNNGRKINLTDSSFFLKSGGSGDKLMLALGVAALGIISDCRPGFDMGYLQKSKSIY